MHGRGTRQRMGHASQRLRRLRSRPGLCGVVVMSALVLASCGGSAGPPASLDKLISSLTSSSATEVQLSGVADSGAGWQLQHEVAYTLDVTVDNPDGSALSSVDSQPPAEFIINEGDQRILDARLIGDTVYFELDFSGITSLPGS